MTVINTNSRALFIQEARAVNERDLEDAMRQMSVGKRVTRAADDPAGLAIGNKLTGQVRILEIAIRNANDGVSLLQTAEAGASSLVTLLNRMRELAIQAGNDTYSTQDRSALQVEFSGLQTELGRVLGSTKWNGLSVLKGELGVSSEVTFHVGMSSADSISLTMSSLNSASLASAQLSAFVSISSRSGAGNALSTIDAAIEQIDRSRGLWGAIANRLTFAADNASNISLSSQAARSAVMDADYAKATSQLARAMILEEAGAAMLSQANQQPYYVLLLLQ